MNRNSQAHFAETPTLSIGRSKFNRSYTHKTTFNAGDLIPFYVEPTILPGDTVKMNTAQVVRMMTPITPVMDNAVLDTYFFFVPYRLIWEHFQEFMGENKTAPWAQNIEREVPQVSAPTGGWTKGSIADFMGVPTKVDNFKLSALPFKAYALIWNEHFRDENLKNPCYISMGDSDIAGKDILDANYDYVTMTEAGAAPLKVAKNSDYFTRALPQAQKGPAVTVPLGTSAPINFAKAPGAADANQDPNLPGHAFAGITINTTNHEFNFVGNDASPAVYPTQGKYWGLVADLETAAAATINALRTSFQVQKFYERQAIGGTRYIELVRSHFSVTNPDYRLQRPEYLGGIRTPININQVVQTDATSQQLGGKYVGEPGSEVWEWSMSELSPQGNTAAYSLTAGNNKDLFCHSFTEHGVLMGLCCVRLQSHTYQQGLNRAFSAKKWSDFYWPEFANLGNMPIYNKEIYLQGNTVVDSDGNIVDDQVFGYQEAWANYRYMPDIVTGEMRSNYDQSLDVWHWADDYESLPYLGSDWIDEDKANFARTLAVQDHDQFMGDFYFDAIYTRPMPLYSVPGLIDHH